MPGAIPTPQRLGTKVVPPQTPRKSTDDSSKVKGLQFALDEANAKIAKLTRRSAEVPKEQHVEMLQDNIETMETLKSIAEGIEHALISDGYEDGLVDFIPFKQICSTKIKELRSNLDTISS